MLKKLPVIINGGFQTRDFIYVQDVVDVILLSMKKIQKKNVQYLIQDAKQQILRSYYNKKII